MYNYTIPVFTFYPTLHLNSYLNIQYCLEGKFFTIRTDIHLMNYKLKKTDLHV
jgi:hypothetical protein